MAREPCIICKGFGKAHPATGGKTDYGSLVFCTCRGDKADTVAHPLVNHPDTDSDIYSGHYYDEFDAGRQERYRKSPAFRQELKELFGDEGGVENHEAAPIPGMLSLGCARDKLDCGPRHDRGEIRNAWRELIQLTGEVNYLKTKLGELLNKPVRTKNGF